MSHIAFRLQLIHRRLDEQLRREQGARFPDERRLRQLKKLKLAIKDQLHRIAPRAVRA